MQRTIFTQLYKIDRENNTYSKENFENIEHVYNYINVLLEKLADEEGERQYNFQAGAITIKSSIDCFIRGELIDEKCELIAKRLLAVDIAAQQKHGHLGIEVQKGMLIISFVEMTDTAKKIIISKADYNVFIEETSGELKEVLPQKKKIFKSFIANVTKDIDGIESVTKLVTYDSNKKVSEYWWDDFLELDVIVSDKINTQRAFDAIEKDILKPIEKDHRQDFLYLWNATIAYFRSEGEFNLSHFKDVIIGTYQPFDENLKINDLKNKVTTLPVKYEFDNRFEKRPNEITKRFKKTIKLTGEIDLVLKHDIPHIQQTFKIYDDLDGKYIMIRSEEGYKYAQSLNAPRINE